MSSPGDVAIVDSESTKADFNMQTIAEVRLKKQREMQTAKHLPFTMMRLLLGSLLSSSCFLVDMAIDTAPL